MCGLLLIYVVLPLLMYIATKLNKKVLLTISIILFSIFFIDEVYNGLIGRWFNVPNANELYNSWGWKIR